MLQRRVIKTKSVEYMPFSLSFFLTLCATMWFFYGLFVKDMVIAVSMANNIVDCLFDEKMIETPLGLNL